MQLDDQVQRMARDLGADLFAIANLALAQDFIRSQGGQDVASYPRAISIGISLLDPIVDQLPQRSEKSVSIEYRHLCMPPRKKTEVGLTSNLNPHNRSNL
jgi:epoxyqueuosine reductase